MDRDRQHVRIAIIGAGFGGLGAAIRLKRELTSDFLVFEQADDVGGTWRANTYPGCTCDVPSHLYSFSFALNPQWTRSFSGQAEIWTYLRDCVTRFGLTPHLRLGHTVTSVAWDDGSRQWLVDTSGGDYRADVVIAAPGPLSEPALPKLPGLDSFAGKVFHSARWDHDHDLTGRRVAVVGTGASAIQVVPAIVDRTAHIDLYQRSAPWIVPRKDPPYSAEQQRVFATRPDEAARHRQGLHDLFEQTTAFFTGDPSVETIAALSRSYLERKVADPGLRARLTPHQPFGCKRTLVSSDYYTAVQRDDVELVTEAIDRITPTGIRTADGVERPADTIVLCTGFRASEYLGGVDVLGRDGTSLQDHWAGVPRAYHGMAVPGFPNFFMLYGPNTNQGGNSILLILEAQAQFVASALDALRTNGATWVEVSAEAMARYARMLERDLQRTVWAGDCDSYFHNAAGDIVTQLPRTGGWYREATRQIDRADFVFGGVTCTTS